MTLRLLFALVLAAALPSLARAQDDTQNQTDTEQAQPQADEAAPAEPADPIEAVQGLWHVDQVEGSAANETTTGSILKVDRQAIASLSGGTCASPGFTAAPDAVDPKQVGVDITCLGQVLASARWNTDDPDTVIWSEPNLDIVLHRVKTATTAQKPASNDGDSTNDDSGEGDDAE
jgi:hypothetical protein